MITRIIIAFVIFAGIAYYYDIDVRAVVAKSGAPQWLAAHGIVPKQSTTTAATSTATTTP